MNLQCNDDMGPGDGRRLWCGRRVEKSFARCYATDADQPAGIRCYRLHSNLRELNAIVLTENVIDKKYVESYNMRGKDAQIPFFTLQLMNVVDVNSKCQP